MNSTQTTANTQPFDILVVDDMVENLRVIAGTLTQADYHVRTATDGELALKEYCLPPAGTGFARYPHARHGWF